MSLKDLHTKISYDSDIDDILNDFYIPVLSNSIEYKRSVGFFSSSSLAIAAEGISQFIRNGGIMQLICGAKLRKSDLEVIKKTHEAPIIVIEKNLLRELDNLENDFIRDHIKALGWMLANDKLKIKVAILFDENGNPLDENRGILHQKIAILKDIDGNKLSFSGSNNETGAAWKSNIEEFKVFRSWKDYEKRYLNTDIRKFETYWTGNAKRMKIIDIPKALKEKLIQIAPENVDDLFLNKKFEKMRKVKLWDYQKEAIKNWNDNDKKGIFEMATGTGKTFTALGCLKKELNVSKNLLTIISAPYQHLVRQWKKSINKFGIEYDDLIIADSSNRNWKDKISDLVLDITLGHKNNAIIITTHNTFSSKTFIEIINKKDKFNIFLIADEVHGLGAGHSRLGLINAYDFRLGLSATPQRWFDDQGTEVISEFFGGVVYEFDLEKAINTTNPSTGETYLTPFIYKSKFLTLDNNELEEYFDITSIYSS